MYCSNSGFTPLLSCLLFAYLFNDWLLCLSEFCFPRSVEVFPGTQPWACALLSWVTKFFSGCSLIVSFPDHTQLLGSPSGQLNALFFLALPLGINCSTIIQFNLGSLCGGGGYFEVTAEFVRIPGRLFLALSSIGSL